MNTEEGLQLDYQPMGRNGKVRLTARFLDGTSFTDRIDIADADGRTRFLKGLCKNRKGINRVAVASELDRIASEVVARPLENDSGAEPVRDSD